MKEEQTQILRKAILEAFIADDSSDISWLMVLSLSGNVVTGNSIINCLDISVEDLTSLMCDLFERDYSMWQQEISETRYFEPHRAPKSQGRFRGADGGMHVRNEVRKSYSFDLDRSEISRRKIDHSIQPRHRSGTEEELQKERVQTEKPIVMNLGEGEKGKTVYIEDDNDVSRDNPIEVDLEEDTGKRQAPFIPDGSV